MTGAPVVPRVGVGAFAPDGGVPGEVDGEFAGEAAGDVLGLAAMVKDTRPVERPVAWSIAVVV